MPVCIIIIPTSAKIQRSTRTRVYELWIKWTNTSYIHGRKTWTAVHGALCFFFLSLFFLVMYYSFRGIRMCTVRASGMNRARMQILTIIQILITIRSHDSEFRNLTKINFNKIILMTIYSGEKTRFRVSPRTNSDTVLVTMFNHKWRVYSVHPRYSTLEKK